MLNKLLLPKLGQTMEIATVEKWHKAEGDSVNKGDVVLEITTDKATLEVESYHKGILLKRFAAEGLALPVNTPLALIGNANDAIPAALAEEINKAIQTGLVLAQRIASGEIESVSQAGDSASVSLNTIPAEPTMVEVSAVAPSVAAAEVSMAEPAGPREVPWRAKTLAERPEHILVSPRARKLADHHKLHLAMIAPTGPGGRIIEKDVRALADQLSPERITPLALTEAYDRQVDLVGLLSQIPGRKITVEDVDQAPVLARKVKAAPSAPPAAIPSPVAGPPKPLTAMRRIVAQRLSQSKREIPHFYLKAVADMTRLVELRGRLNRATGVKHSYNDFILKALGMNLVTYPAMAGRWTDKGIVNHARLNVGLAVALDDGLMVPVVRDVDRQNVTELANQSAQLVEKARNKKLLPDECEGACMTVSNLGAFHIEWVLPIINPGECSILGVGAIEPRVVVIDGNIGVREMCTLTLATDHRLADGATAAAFLRHLCELLQQPTHLLPPNAPPLNGK